LESEADTTSDTGSDMEDIVDSDDKRDFNLFEDGEDIIDMNMV
jgi:hypothetical protein